MIAPPPPPPPPPKSTAGEYFFVLRNDKNTHWVKTTEEEKNTLRLHANISRHLSHVLHLQSLAGLLC